jgi:hypothetical protein
MTRYRITFLISVFVALALLPAVSQAQSVSRLWAFTPKAGAGPAVAEAIRAHVAFRDGLGDPWDWDIYEVEVGEETGKFYAASWNHSWPDFDAYDAWDNGPAAGTHFQATVAPLLEDVSNEIMRSNPDIVKLPTDPNYVPTLLNVTDFYLIPGKQMAFSEAIKKIHEAIVAADMPFYYSSDTRETGGTGPIFSIAGWGQSWADFADPDPSMEQAMVQQYGEEEAMEIFTAFSEAVHHWDSFVVRYRPDLSSARGM